MSRVKTVAGWILGALVVLGFLPAVAGAQLQALAEPGLEALEPMVAEQLRNAHRLTMEELSDETVPAAERAEAIGELGVLYQAYELNENAMNCYREAETLGPRDSRWPYYSAHILRQTGQLADAEAALRRSLELKPEYVPGWVYLGQLLLELDRPNEAIEVLARALELDPGAPAAHAAIGEAELARKNYSAATEHLEAALQAVPAATRLNYPLAMAYRGLGQMDLARDLLARHGSIGIRPPDPLLEALQTVQVGERVSLLRGRGAYRVGRYEEAAAAFRQAADAAPESVPAHVNLGAALAATGDVQGAVRAFREALSLDPVNSAARFNLAMLLARAGETAEAIEHLQALVRENQDDSQAQVELGMLLERQGDFVQALGHYDRALATQPRDPRARVGYVASLVGLGQLQEALDALETGLRLAPGDGLTAHALARLLASSPLPEQRDGARALDLAQRVFAAQPTSEHAATVALALAELERCDEAVDWMQRAIGKAGEGTAVDRMGRIALEGHLVDRPCRVPHEGTADRRE